MPLIDLVDDPTRLIGLGGNPESKPDNIKTIKNTPPCLPHLDQLPEVGAAGGEHHPVSADLLSLAAQGDVHQLPVLTQVVEHRGDTRLEPVPFQTELLRVHHLRTDTGVRNGMR